MQSRSYHSVPESVENVGCHASEDRSKNYVPLSLPTRVQFLGLKRESNRNREPSPLRKK